MLYDLTLLYIRHYKACLHITLFMEKLVTIQLKLNLRLIGQYGFKFSNPLPKLQINDKELMCDAYENTPILRKRCKYGTIDTSHAESFIHSIKCYYMIHNFKYFQGNHTHDGPDCSILKPSIHMSQLH